MTLFTFEQVIYGMITVNDELESIWK